MEQQCGLIPYEGVTCLSGSVPALIRKISTAHSIVRTSVDSVISISCPAVTDKKWTELDTNQHRTHAMRLLDGLEVTAREKRLKVARAILYVAQGTVMMSPGTPDTSTCDSA